MSLYYIIIITFLYFVEFAIELAELSISLLEDKHITHYTLKYYKKNISNFLMLNLIYTQFTQYFIGYFNQMISTSTSIIISCVILFLNIILRSVILYIPKPAAIILSYILFIPNYIFQWAGIILSKIGFSILKLFGIEKDQDKLINIQAYRQELLLDIKQVNLEKPMEELKIIESALRFRDTEVYKIMTERDDFIMININHSIESILVYIHTYARSYNKLVVIDNYNQILGTVRSVDIWQTYSMYKAVNLYEILQPVLLIPYNATIYTSIKYFVSNSKSSLFVINKNNYIIGMLTLHDVTQEIFGIDDNEYYFRFTQNGYILDGEYNIRMLNRKMEWNIPDEQITLSDFLMTLVNNKCHIYQIIVWQNFIFKIIAIHNNQPYRVLTKYNHESKSIDN